MYAKLVFRNARRSVKDYLIYIVTIIIVEGPGGGKDCESVIWAVGEVEDTIRHIGR